MVTNKDELVYWKIQNKYLSSTANRGFEKNLKRHDTFEQVKARAKKENRKLKKL